MIRLRTGWRAGLLLGALLAGAVPALGIADFETEMPGYYEALGLDPDRRDYDYELINFRSNAPGNVFFPGEQPELAVQIRNRSDRELVLAGNWELLRWDSRQIPGEMWSAVMSRRELVEKIPAHYRIAPGGYVDVTLKPRLPERFGGYALVLNPGPEAGVRFLTSICRILRNESRPIQFPRQAGEFFEPAAMKRVGLQAVRFGVPFKLAGTKGREELMASLDRTFRAMQENHVAATLEIGTGGEGFVMGVPRPHLDENGIMQQTKADWVWHPQYDEDYRNFVYELVARYGWPKGPVNGIMLWNEPWEGISISGWGADMIRYRDLYRIMAEATRQAEQEAGVRVLVGGCDSGSNTFDKLFPNESDEFLPALDFCSIHYHGLSAPSLYRKWLNRKPERVLIWDTESWVGNADDVLATTVAANRAAGYDRSMGFFNGYVFGNNLHDNRGNRRSRIQTSEGEREVELPLIAYPMAAALAATQHFIGERAFDRVLLLDGLPWLFVFKGLDEEENPGFWQRWFGRDSEDGTIVLSGDLERIFGDGAPLSRIRGLKEVAAKKFWRKQLEKLQPGTGEWREAVAALRKLQPHLKINDRNLISLWRQTLEKPWAGEGVTFVFAADPAYQVFDLYGNEVAPERGEYRLPLDSASYFLRSRARGGAKKLEQAVLAGQLYGVTPVELLPHDFLSPVREGSELTLEIHNVLNRELTGTLSAQVGKLQLDYPKQLTLRPFERRQVALRVVGGAADPENFYRSEFQFDAGADGVSELSDVMRVNRIARRTIQVDGDLRDWEGVLPQRALSSDHAARTQMEAAWLPFDQVSDLRRGGQAEVRLAADDDFFYLSARITDPAPSKGTLRFARRNDDDFFYPEVSRDYVKERTFTWDRQEEADANARVEGPEGGRLSGTVRPKIERLRFDLELPAGRLTQVTAYLPYSDFRSGRQCLVRLLDTASGRELAQHPVWQVKGGAFVSFAAAGQVSLEVINQRWWHRESGRLAGIFFDPYRGELKVRDDGATAQATFLELDEQNPGLWRGRFGELGYLLPGNHLEKLSAGIRVRQRDDVTYHEYHWPEGVRRFSYRKRPILPDGASSGFANLQIAFNSIPVDQDPVVLDTLPGRPVGFINYRSTDRQFALNQVADEFGGGTEIWRLEVPEAPRKHFYPRQPKAAWEGAVEGGKLVIRYDGNIRIVEAAIPWSEMPEVKALRDAGKPVKFTFRANREGAASIELGEGRAITTSTGSTFSPDWKRSFSNELEFSFE